MADHICHPSVPSKKRALLDSGSTKAALALTPKSVSQTLTQASHKRQMCDLSGPHLQQHRDAHILQVYCMSSTATFSTLDLKYRTTFMGL